ncbi:MAG: hypothetical protein SFU21_13655 [Flavihumibacter sp.]|nr:hypothetical protein [Flavihumibacter sp.]
MTRNELQNIIDTLETSISFGDSSFGIFDAGQNGDFYIKANKDGLMMLALELLKADQKSDNFLNKEEQPFIRFPEESNLINAESDICVIGIEVIKGKLTGISREKDKPSFSDKVFKFGCLSLLIIMIIAMLVGFVKLFQLIF